MAEFANTIDEGTTLDFDLFESVEDILQIDNCMDEFLQTLHTCSHHHSCDPPGPDNTHTHTCTHTHTHVIPAPEFTDTSRAVSQSLNNEFGTANGENEESKSEAGTSVKGFGEAGTDNDANTNSSFRKKASGNKEAVKKYREKKKAHTARLEEELDKQKALNQQLLRRLQTQSGLEAEVVRLRRLLHDIRNKLDSELSDNPLCFKPTSNSVPISYMHAVDTYHFPKPASEHWIPLPPCPESHSNEQFMVQRIQLPSCDSSLPCIHKPSKRARALGRFGNEPPSMSQCTLTTCSVECSKPESFSK